MSPIFVYIIKEALTLVSALLQSTKVNTANYCVKQLEWLKTSAYNSLVV